MMSVIKQKKDKSSYDKVFVVIKMTIMFLKRK